MRKDMANKTFYNLYKIKGSEISIQERYREASQLRFCQPFEYHSIRYFLRGKYKACRTIYH